MQILKDIFFHDFSNPDSAPRLHAFSPSSSSSASIRLVAQDHASSALAIRSRPVLISRSSKVKARLLQQSMDRDLQGSQRGSDETDEWETVLVPGPDLTDKTTVVNLAKMCSDAYIFGPTRPDWLNTTLGFNRSSSFGWEGDGLRGHIFSDKENDT